MNANQKKLYADSYVEYNKNTNGSFVFYPLDINNPVHGAAVPNYDTPGGVKFGNTKQTADYISVYALDELLFFNEKLRLTLSDVAPV